MEAVKGPISYADLQRMPDDGNRYELYDGELCMVPSPLLKHQIVAARLYDSLRAFVRAHGGAVFFAPLDIVLSDFDVVQPDVIYFSPGAARALDPQSVVRVPPDVAFEVLSPSTARNDRGRKRDLMARYGVPEYWTIDSDVQVIEVSRLGERGYGPPQRIAEGRCASSVIAGFAVDLAELFAPGLN